MRFTVVDQHPGARRSSRSSSSPRSSRASSTRRCWTNIPPEAGGTSFLPFGIGGIFPAIPFAIWFFLAIEELPLAAEESHGPEAGHPAGHDLGDDAPCSSPASSIAVPQHGPRRARRRSATPRRRCSTGSRRSSARARAAELLGLVGLIGLDRELLHDHLRVRPEHVLAVAGRLLPEVAVDHAPDAEDAARRAASPARSSGYLLGRADLPARQVRERDGGPDRRRAAVHGGVRRRDLLRDAVPVVHPAAAEDARTSSGRTGARWASWARRSPASSRVVSLVSLYSERGLPARRCTGRSIYFLLGDPLLRDRRAAPPGALARGGVRAHERASAAIPAGEGYSTSAAEQEAILRGGDGRRAPPADRPDGTRHAERRSGRRARASGPPPLPSERGGEDGATPGHARRARARTTSRERGEIDTVLCMFTDLQGRFMGKRVLPDFFLEEILGEEGLHACLYLLAIDMEMEPLPGYAYASWETGYGDFRMVPDMATLRLVPVAREDRDGALRHRRRGGRRPAGRGRAAADPAGPDRSARPTPAT